MDLVKKTDGEIVSLHQIANIEFQSTELNDSQVTISDWLKELLAHVWIEKDQFSGKRAFGNSSWEYDLYEVLVREDIISGVIDKYGYIENCDSELADKIILDIIVKVL